MIPIANAQNEFKSSLIANYTVTYGKSTVENAWKVENGTTFDPTAKKKQS
jgi:hypothetical protein